jgi:PAS domain S-box-containing protein
MKTKGWLSLKTIWLTVLLVASSCALILAGWVFAEWRVEHVGKELRGNLLRQTGELASIINPAHVTALSFQSKDKSLPAYERITEQLKAYTQDMSVAAVYGLGLRDDKIVYGPSVFYVSGESVVPGTEFKTNNKDLETLIKSGNPVIIENTERQVIIALAPVFDPKTNEVIMAAVLEIATVTWGQALADVRYLPFAIVLVLLTLQFLGAGLLFLRTALLPSRLHHLETVFAAFFCCLLAGVVVFFVHESENRARRIRFMEIAESETKIVENSLRSIQQQITQIALFVEKSSTMTADAFAAFSESLLRDDAVELCYLITSLQAAEKGSLEQRAAEEGMQDYRIHQLDESEEKIPVSEEAGILYPIYYQAKPLPGAMEPGFDLGSIPEARAALEIAAHTGLATAVVPERDNIINASGKRIAVYVPVYESDGAGALLLRGYVGVTIRFDLLLQNALSSMAENSSHLAMEMFLLVANEAPLPIANVDKKTGEQIASFSFLQDMGDVALSSNHSMSVFSYTYVLMLHPSPEYFQEYPLRNAYIAALVALVISIVVTIFVGSLRNQQIMLESRIWESTVGLRESGETFRRLFAESTDPILLLLQGRIVDCNNATLRLLKCGSKQQIVKKRPEDFAPPKQPDGRPSPYLFKEMVQLCVRNGNHAFEFTHAKSDGTLVPVETMLTLITIRGENHIHVVWRDITERKLAEEALRSSEEKYRSLVDSIPIGLYRFTPSPEERFVMANKAMVKIYGAASTDELMGVSAGELYADPQDREALWQALEENGSVEGHEVQLKRKDGSIIWGSISGTILRNSRGEIECFDGSVMDITERKLASEERMEMERRLLHSQKLESLGVLAGGIAHDFNNLLAIVLGNLEFAAGEIHGATPAHDCITKASLAARRAAALTDQMLAYSGKGRFVIKAMDLSVEVEENLQILSSSISKGVKLDLNLQDSLPPIYADEGQIQQVVMNLITNASEAIGDTEGTIAITTAVTRCTEEDLQRSQLEEKPEPGEFILLEIRDTGCGMDEETKKRAFDPFFSTKFTGRGLGMSAVLGIVQGHRGALELESEVGKGTTIRLLFPVAEPPEDLPVAEAYEPEKPQVAERPRLDAWSGTFLVVDDEAPLRELGEKVLARFGFDTITAVDGQEAVEIFEQHADDIVAVLLDLTMPRMDGVAAFEAMRRIKPDVKVILCSGFSEHEAMQRFSGQGLAGYVHKPYRITVLREEIEKVMKGEGNLA